MTETKISPQEELYHIQESTNDDGTVDVEILGWGKVAKIRDDQPSQVTVEFQLPTVETKTETMPWPEKDTDDYKFVRVVRQCGYDLASADAIVGERVKSDGEELIVPKQESFIQNLIPSGRKESNTDNESDFWIYVVFAPIFAMAIITDHITHPDDFTRGYVVSLVSIIIYSFLIYAAYLVSS